MAIFDIFKRKKEKKELKKEKIEKVKRAEETPKVKVEKKEPVKKPVKTTKKKQVIYNVLKEPHITEKATDLVRIGNKYTFKVYKKANKIEVKKAVESLYGVDVISVNIVNISRKKRRLGKTRGFKPGYKKAIVKIKQGQKIEILPT